MDERRDRKNHEDSPFGFIDGESFQEGVYMCSEMGGWKMQVGQEAEYHSMEVMSYIGSLQSHLVRGTRLSFTPQGSCLCCRQEIGTTSVEVDIQSISFGIHTSHCCRSTWRCPWWTCPVQEHIGTSL